MTSNSKYLFQSERLGFRTWCEEDFADFAAMNADPKVMEYFPKTMNTEEARAFFERLQNHFQKHNYGYLPVELLSTGEFIGFMGLAFQEYESVFTPATDIGWRLKISAWGNGYATEGALRWLEYAFNELGLGEVYSTCTVKNLPSENVMRKIGMEKQGNFNHPKLHDYPELANCVYYRITKDEF